MFIPVNKIFFIEKINNFFNGYDKAKLDEMSVFCLKIFNKEITVSATVEKIALRHLFYLYKVESDKSFPFIYNEKAVKKFKKYEKIMKENRNISFENEIHLLAGFLFGWVHKNNKNQFMIKRVLDLTNCSRTKEIFWSFIMIWASIDLFNAKETNVIIWDSGQKSNLTIFRKIINYVDTIPEINKNIFKSGEDLILSSKLGKIKIDNIDNYLENRNNPKFIYMNKFYDYFDNNLMLKLENTDLNNTLVVYDGNFNQNIEAKSSYLTLKYKYKLEEQTSKMDLDYSEYETLLWEPNIDINSEFFYENSKKSTLYYSLLKKSNDKMKEYLDEQTKQDFFGEQAVLGVEYNQDKQIAITLMFNTKYNAYKNGLVFKNILIIANSFLENKNEIVAKVYEKWISQKSIIVAGEKNLNLNKIAKIFKLLKEKYNIVNVIFKEYNIPTQNLVDNFLIKNKIFSEEIVTRIKSEGEIWENLQTLNGRLFSKEVYFFDEDFAFRQMLNFSIEEEDRKLFIKRISSNFPCGNLFSSLACVGKTELLENNINLEKCACQKLKSLQDSEKRKG